MDNIDKLELKSTLKIDTNPEIYKIIDFLNKNLKEKNLIFGVNKSEDKMIISIYET